MSGDPIRKTLAVAASAALLVAALAVPAMAGNDKVTICHKPLTPAQQTLEVAAPAVDAHLLHGDALGACASTGTPICEALRPYAEGGYHGGGETLTNVVFVGDERISIGGSQEIPEGPFEVRVTVGTKQRIIESHVYVAGDGSTFTDDAGTVQHSFAFRLPAPGWGSWPKGETVFGWEVLTPGLSLDTAVRCTRE